MQLDSNLPGYQIMDHHECVRAIVRRRTPIDRFVAAEVRLPNGRIADVLAISPWQSLTIWEVKTRWRASELSEAWEKYARFVDYLWFVSLSLADADWAAFNGQSAWPGRAAAAGVMSYLGGVPRIFRAASVTRGDPVAKLALTRSMLCSGS